MSSELPCYTLINGSIDSDSVPNEQQLKHDLGRSEDWVLICVVLNKAHPNPAQSMATIA